MTPSAEFTVIGGAIATGQSIVNGKNITDVAIDVISNKIKLKTKKNISFSNLTKFKNDEAISHFNKHSSEVMQSLGKSSYNFKEYIKDANYIIKQGTFVPELNGYVKLIGEKGSAKYGFVGLDRKTNNLTTFHIKSTKELSKKAPSLGIKF